MNIRLKFNEEESSLIGLCKEKTRLATISRIVREADEMENKELKQLAREVVEKLGRITDMDFNDTYFPIGQDDD